MDFKNHSIEIVSILDNDILKEINCIHFNYYKYDFVETKNYKDITV